MRYVLDCSVAVKWFVPEALSDVAHRLLERVEAGEVELLAPDSIVAELGYILRKAVLNKEMSAERCEAIIQDYTEVPVTPKALAPLAVEAMRLTARHMANFYDALYIALAIRENLKVLTADRPMTLAFAKLGRTVHLADLRLP